MQVGLRRVLYRAGSGVSLAESKRQHTPPSGTGVNLSLSLNVNLMNPFHPFHTLGDNMIGEIFLSQYIVLIDEARGGPWPQLILVAVPLIDTLARRFSALSYCLR